LTNQTIQFFQPYQIRSSTQSLPHTKAGDHGHSDLGSGERLEDCIIAVSWDHVCLFKVQNIVFSLPLHREFRSSGLTQSFLSMQSCRGREHRQSSMVAFLMHWWKFIKFWYLNFKLKTDQKPPVNQSNQPTNKKIDQLTDFLFVKFRIYCIYIWSTYGVVTFAKNY
jgi:hypothetical protein